MPGVGVFDRVVVEDAGLRDERPLLVLVVIERPDVEDGVAPDVDAIYNPVVFYGTRLTARATTGGYAVVDTAAVRLARVSAWTINEPREAVESALPRGARGWYDERVESTPGKTGLRVGIGETVLVVSVVLSAVILVVML